MSKPPLVLALVLLAALAPAVAGHGSGVSRPTNAGDERAMVLFYLPYQAQCHDPRIDVVHFSAHHDETTLYASQTVKSLDIEPYCAPFGQRIPLIRGDVWWAFVLEDMKAMWGIHMVTYEHPDGTLERCIEMGPYTQYGILKCDEDVSNPTYAWSMPLVGTYTAPWGEEIAYDLRGMHFDNVAAYSWSQAFVDPSQPRLKVDFFDDSPKAQLTI